MRHHNQTIVGVDISKAYFDVFFKDPNGERKTKDRISNNKEGFKKLLKVIPQGAWVVMEASGPYYYQLACFLYEKSTQVAVINPLVIRRFMQMQLKRVKTDASDAQSIAAYGEKMNLKAWKPLKENYLKIKQWYAIRKQFLKHHHAISQQLEAFSATGNLDNKIKRVIKKEINQLDKKIWAVEEQMNELIEQENGALKEQLESIPGIGSKTSLLLIVALRGFEDFDNYKQVISYLGLSPRIYESGSSVKGKAKICKMGMSEVRKCLYMAARSARRYNLPCKELYDRLKAKGKAHRQAMIAVVNKLLKQAFAIVTAGTLYDKNYQCEGLNSK